MRMFKRPKHLTVTATSAGLATAAGSIELANSANAFNQIHRFTSIPWTANPYLPTILASSLLIASMAIAVMYFAYQAYHPTTTHDYTVMSTASHAVEVSESSTTTDKLAIAVPVSAAATLAVFKFMEAANAAQYPSHIVHPAVVGALLAISAIAAAISLFKDGWDDRREFNKNGEGSEVDDFETHNIPMVFDLSPLPAGIQASNPASQSAAAPVASRGLFRWRVCRAAVYLWQGRTPVWPCFASNTVLKESRYTLCAGLRRLENSIRAHAAIACGCALAPAECWFGWRWC